MTLEAMAPPGDTDAAGPARRGTLIKAAKPLENVMKP